MCDFWNIAATISSVVLSVCAIIISLATANKQNKIALFEERYRLYLVANEFFDNAYSYYKTGDQMSISLNDLVRLEYNFDIQTEKAKFLFDKKINETLIEAKELFGEHMRFFGKNNSNFKTEEDIKIKIKELRIKFEKQVSDYLKL